MTTPVIVAGLLLAAVWGLYLLPSAFGDRRRTPINSTEEFDHLTKVMADAQRRNYDAKLSSARDQARLRREAALAAGETEGRGQQEQGVRRGAGGREGTTVGPRRARRGAAGASRPRQAQTPTEGTPASGAKAPEAAQPEAEQAPAAKTVSDEVRAKATPAASTQEPTDQGTSSEAGSQDKSEAGSAGSQDRSEAGSAGSQDRSEAGSAGSPDRSEAGSAGSPDTNGSNKSGSK